MSLRGCQETVTTGGSTELCLREVCVYSPFPYLLVYLFWARYSYYMFTLGHKENPSYPTAAIYPHFLPPVFPTGFRTKSLATRLPVLMNLLRRIYVQHTHTPWIDPKKHTLGELLHNIAAKIHTLHRDSICQHEIFFCFSLVNFPTRSSGLYTWGSVSLTIGPARYNLLYLDDFSALFLWSVLSWWW